MGTPVADLLEAQPPSFAHASALKHIGVEPDDKPLFDVLILACTAGSALWGGKPVAVQDVTHLPALEHTASAARDLTPCMEEGAMPMPADPKLEHGQMLVLLETGPFFGVPVNDSESFTSFRSLAKASSHDADAVPFVRSHLDRGIRIKQCFAIAAIHPHHGRRVGALQALPMCVRRSLGVHHRLEEPSSGLSH